MLQETMFEETLGSQWESQKSEEFYLKCIIWEREIGMRYEQLKNELIHDICLRHFHGRGNIRIIISLKMVIFSNLFFPFKTRNENVTTFSKKNIFLIL